MTMILHRGKYIISLGFSFVLFVTLFSPAFSSSKSDDGWNALINNDRTAARKNFSESISDDPKNSSAYIGLALLSEMELRYDDAWNAFVKSLPYQENVNAYLFANLRNITAVNQDNPSLGIESFLEKLSDRSDLDPTLKAVVYEVFGSYYEHKGDLSKARKLYAKLNTTDDWSLIGPFENISASGFEKQFLPEKEYRATTTYEGKNGIPVQWFRMKEIRNDRWIDFQRYFAYDNSIFYANTFLYSSKKQQVNLRVGTSGSLKAFLNDNIILSVFDENNNDLDTYVAETELQPGWNRLLIKCGYSEITRCNFMTRITDAQGNPVEGIKISTDPHDYTSTPGAPVRVIENFAEAFYRKQTEAHPQQLENYLLLVKCYLLNDKAVEAELTLRKALEIAPQCALIFYNLLEAYQRGEKSDEVSSTYEKLVSLDPSSPPSIEYKLGQAFANEQYDNAGELINNFSIIPTDSQRYYTYLINLYAKKNQIEQMKKAIHDAFNRYPYNWTFAYIEATTKVQETKSPKDGIEILQKHLKYFYNVSALSEIANLQLTLSDISGWENTYKKMLDFEPSATGFYSKMADTYFALKRFDKAGETISKALALCPNHPTYLLKLADIYRSDNQIQKAIDAYRTTLRFDPTQYTARQTLRELEGKKTIYSVFHQNNIDSLIKAAPQGDGMKDEAAVVLLSDTKRIVYGMGASEKIEETLIKVFNNSGVDDFKEYWVSYNGYNEKLIVEEASVIKSNGSKIKADIDENHIVFKSLEANDCIYLKWHIQSFYSGKLSSHFWDKVYMSYSYPSKLISYSLLVPESLKFEYKAQNFGAEPVSQNTPDGVLYEWSVLNEPSFETEIGMPPFDDIAKILYISTIKSWSYLVDWYSDLAKTKTRPSFEIKEQVQKLFAGKGPLTDEEKMNTIFNFITENIRYSSVSFRQSALIPQKARTVLVSKIGDCKDVATLGISMLREVGIKADYVLVQTKDQGKNFNILPSIAFNHCIVRAETNDGDRYLDFTAYNYPMKSTPVLDAGAFSLTIKEGVTAPAYIDQKMNVPSNFTRALMAEILKDNSMKANVVTTKSGESSAQFRNWLRDKGQKDKEKTLTQSMSRDFPNLTVSEFITGNLDSLSSSVQYSFSFTVPSYVTESGQLRLFKIPWDDHLDPAEGLSYQTRKYPYQWWSLDTLVEEVNITVPKEYRLEHLPEKVSFSTSSASYSVEYHFNKSILNAKRTMIITNDLISPEEYSSFKDFYNNALKEDMRQLVFKIK